MTFPAYPTPVIYASVADLRNVLDGTDSGTGTAAALTDNQLQLALQSASARVSVYFGSIMDGSNAQAQPPLIFHDLTLDLAAFWATKTYLKNKVIAQDHPIYIAYKDAQQMLQDVRDGKIRFDPVVPGSTEATSEVGVVINNLPRIFTGRDSNTRYDWRTGTIEPDTPIGQWSPSGSDDFESGWGGALYQG